MGGRATCVFHVESATSPDAVSAASTAGASGHSSAGSAGSAGNGASTISVQRHAMLGSYLADSRGMSLYIFGADVPGDCSHPPVSTCLAADGCIVAWPAFHAAPRSLAIGLDARLFGEYLRSDGVMQTTYRGWPLYYYRSDAAAGEVKGHARGIWYLAETELPNVLVRRTGTERHLSDAEGRTLYAFAEDTLGTADALPSSACVDACLDTYRPFLLRYLAPVSVLEPADFTFFIRADGAAQVAFKGAPLYWSNLDQAPGDTLGLGSGWTLVPDR